MPKLKRMSVIGMAVALCLAGGQVPAAQEASPDAAACLARPTVTCAVELALAASATGGDDHERAQLLVRAANRLEDIGARRTYLDQAAARFFSTGSPAATYLERERRVLDIAAAIVNDDAETADRRFSEVVDNFQLWWTTLSDVIDVLAMAGRPELAVETEARYHFTDTVNLKDGLGRDIGTQVWTTQELLAQSLVRCDCGPDALPMVLALPEQVGRVDLAIKLYARRFDLEGLTSFLAREFGNLADLSDERQRQWVGYGFGLMIRELPLDQVPSAVAVKPTWLEAGHLGRPPDSGMPPGARLYGSLLARAIEAGDGAALTALLELRTGDDVNWLSGMALTSPDAASRVAGLLPQPERNHLDLLIVQAMLLRGDAGKALEQAMALPAAEAWRKPSIGEEEAFEFEFHVLEPLLARGAYDLAEEAVRRLGDAELREVERATIAEARSTGPIDRAEEDATTVLAALWHDYLPRQGNSAAGQTFLFAVRDLIAAHPDAFPAE